MAGYNWQAGKSNNAVSAENDGKMTATAFAKWARRFKQFTGCTAADVKAAGPACEWHHTSKFYNATVYYDKKEMAFWFRRRALAMEIKNRKEYTRLVKLAKQAGEEWVWYYDDDRGCLRQYYPLPQKWGHGPTDASAAYYIDDLRDSLIHRDILECKKETSDGR